mmetsp:Transcript_6834/g.10149  ORF Transcript_6834/g.10149 Transcript_6834/m.10149 type:complete len:431 (+) Transcript_6834:346-1638(+)
MFCEIEITKITVNVNSENIQRRPNRILDDSVVTVITLVDGDVIKTAQTVSLTRSVNLRDSTQIVYTVNSDSKNEKNLPLSLRGHYNWKLCLSVLDCVSDSFIIFKDSMPYKEISLPLIDNEGVIGKLLMSTRFTPIWLSLPLLISECGDPSKKNSSALLSSQVNDMLSSLEASECHDSESELFAARASLVSSLKYFCTAVLPSEALEEGMEASEYRGSLWQSFQAFAVHSTSSKGSDAEDDVAVVLTLPLYKAATLAKSFLTALSSDLSSSSPAHNLSVPAVTMDLVEKMLAVFAANSQEMFVAEGGGREEDGDEETTPWSWPRFLGFCTSAGVWLLRQGLLSLQLLAASGSEEGLSLRELDALRFAFMQYDADLSGVVPVTDLFYLLQDMGEEYSEAELALACSEQGLDPAGLGELFFEDLVGWWLLGD